MEALERRVRWTRSGAAGLIIKAVLGVAALMAVFSYVEANYRFGHVIQELRCLKDTSAVLYEINGERPQRGALYATRVPDLALDIFDPDQVFVKRVAGLPGDKVSITIAETRINDVVLASGLSLAEHLGHSPGDYERSFTVPLGHVFMLGETQQSYDSRYYGSVPMYTHGLGRGWRLW